MKTPEEYIKYGVEGYTIREIIDNISTPEIIDIIKEVQKDAYNQALEDAAENAKIIEGQHPDSKYDPRPVFTYNVDKQSILKLKKQ